MGTIHQQLKQRRTQLGLKQEDMHMQIGMLRQQYQKLEASGNPGLDNLELVAKGLRLHLMLIPEEKLQAVKAILEQKTPHSPPPEPAPTHNLVDNPWADILGEEE